MSWTLVHEQEFPIFNEQGRRLWPMTIWQDETWWYEFMLEPGRGGAVDIYLSRTDKKPTQAADTGRLRLLAYNNKWELEAPVQVKDMETGWELIRHKAQELVMEVLL